MTITNIDTEEDLERLRENEVAEGISIDYKVSLYGPAPSDGKEFLKDVSSFANTSGGQIVIGISETGGLPTAVPGVAANLDAEIRRYENLLRDLMEPRILGIRMVPIRLQNGKQALVIRIPKSWNPPHAVLHNTVRRIFARNSAGVHEASVDEMRTMFVAGATLLERAREFQRKRIQEIHSGDGGGPVSFVGEGGRVVLHIVPFSALADESSFIDLRLFYAKPLPPIWDTGFNSNGYNADGYYTVGSGSPPGYVQVFRNGIIETAAGDVRTKFQDGKLYLLARRFDNEIAASVRNYMPVLSSVGVSCPVIIMVAGVRMANTFIFPGERISFLPPEIRRSELHFPWITIEAFGSQEDYRKALKPIFDAIWNAAGNPDSG
jgi:hypothetical protein